MLPGSTSNSNARQGDSQTQGVGRIESGTSIGNVAAATNGRQVKELDKGLHALYVTTFAVSGSDGNVLSYHQPYKKGKPVCSFSAVAPTDVASDSVGNMYVLNLPAGTSGTTTLNVYGPDCGSQTVSITDPYGVGSSLRLYGSTWYIGNEKGPSDSPGNVAVCSQSGCNADLTVSPSHPLSSELYGIAVDKNGNVYGDGVTKRGRKTLLTIFEWAKGANPGKPVYKFPSGYAEGWGSAMEIDNDGNLLINNYFGGLIVLSGCPANCVIHGPFGLTNNGAVAGVALNHAGTKLFAAYESANVPSIDVYAYHGTNGVTYKYSITKGLSEGAIPYGVALVPPHNP